MRGISRRWLSIGLGASATLAVVAIVGRLGLEVTPRPFAPYRADSIDQGMTPLPEDLPAPVARFYRAGPGGPVRTTRTAVVSGRGHLVLNGLTFPTRFRFVERDGRDYRHYIECTLFGLPIFKVNEWYVDGRFRQQLPFGTASDDPKLGTAANLALWGEAIWMPSVLIGDPRIHWEALDASSARLVIPSGPGEDSFAVVFDPETRLIRSMTALRFRAATDVSKTPWRVDFLAWQTFNGVRVPATASITWLDQSKPWFVMTIEEIVYNTDVGQYMLDAGA